MENQVDRVRETLSSILPHMEEQVKRLTPNQCSDTTEKTLLKLFKNALCWAGVRRAP